jgi:hypothetical protein
MTEAGRIYLKLNIIGLVAVGIGVLATYWPGGLVSIMIVLGSFFVVAYVVFTGWDFGQLGRRLSAMSAADAEAAREEFFAKFPWLRRERKQANSAVEGDARQGQPRTPHRER